MKTEAIEKLLAQFEKDAHIVFETECTGRLHLCAHASAELNVIKREIKPAQCEALAYIEEGAGLTAILGVCIAALRVLITKIELIELLNEGR